MVIDAKGKACPMPVIMLKKELDAGTTDIAIEVDNAGAVENLKRLIGTYSLKASVEDKQGVYVVSVMQGDEDSVAIIGNEKDANKNENNGLIDTKQIKGIGNDFNNSCNIGCGYSVFISRETIGNGDGALGHNLMKMAIYTLSESEQIPTYLLFMNGGVKLLTGEEPQIIENINTLIDKGCQVLVCGTCLDYYGIKEKLQVGTVSNMYDIISSMQNSVKTITL